MLKFYKEKSIFDASLILKKNSDFPKIMLLTWQRGFLRSIVNSTLIEHSYLKCLHNFSHSSYNLKKICFKGKTFAFSVIALGAPFVAQFMEEMIALGVEKFVFVGSCGVLSDNLKSDIIVPDKAFRDEGTSYHYSPSEDEAFLISTSDKVCSIFDRLTISYEKGSVWTTDALYRETPSAVSYYKSKGCIAVDMECSAITAVANYKKVEAYQFFFTADSLRENKWKVNRLFKMSKNCWDTYLYTALEICLRI